jgi:hypothetical protein
VRVTWKERTLQLREFGWKEFSEAVRACSFLGLVHVGLRRARGGDSVRGQSRGWRGSGAGDMEGKDGAAAGVWWKEFLEAVRACSFLGLVHVGLRRARGGGAGLHVTCRGCGGWRWGCPGRSPMRVRFTTCGVDVKNVSDKWPFVEVLARLLY